MTLFMLAAYGFICAAVYHLCPAQIRWAVLLLASYGFYASRSLAGLPFILLTTVSTWLASLVIAQIGENGKAQTNAADRERKKAIKAQTRRRQRAAMLAADVIVAKGQGNFETLSGSGLNVYYLFLAKCPHYTKWFGMEHMAGQLLHEKRA